MADLCAHYSRIIVNIAIFVEIVLITAKVLTGNIIVMIILGIHSIVWGIPTVASLTFICIDEINDRKAQKKSK